MVLFITITASETDDYSETKREIKVLVDKPIPDYTIPEGFTARYGQYLWELNFPDGWSLDYDYYDEPEYKELEKEHQRLFRKGFRRKS